MVVGRLPRLGWTTVPRYMYASSQTNVAVWGVLASLTLTTTTAPSFSFLLLYALYFFALAFTRYVTYSVSIRRTRLLSIHQAVNHFNGSTLFLVQAQVHVVTHQSIDSSVIIKSQEATRWVPGSAGSHSGPQTPSALVTHPLNHPSLPPRAEGPPVVCAGWVAGPPSPKVAAPPPLRPTPTRGVRRQTTLWETSDTGNTRRVHQIIEWAGHPLSWAELTWVGGSLRPGTTYYYI